MVRFCPRFKFSLRTLLVVVTVASLFCAYVGSYRWLRRRGMEEVLTWDKDPVGFLYVSWDEASATRDLTRHHRLARFYWPLNQIDNRLFGTPGPIRGATWVVE